MNQRPLPRFCGFVGPIEKKNTKFVVLVSDLQMHLHVSSATAEWNMTKLYRKQELNVIFKVRVFRVNQ